MNEWIIKALRERAGERSMIMPECTLEGQAADVIEQLDERVAELENRIVVTTGGVDVDLLAVVEKHRRTIERLSAKLRQATEYFEKEFPGDE